MKELRAGPIRFILHNLMFVGFGLLAYSVTLTLNGKKFAFSDPFTWGSSLWVALILIFLFAGFTKSRIAYFTYGIYFLLGLLFLLYGYFI